MQNTPKHGYGAEVTNYRRGAKHKNTDSSPMLSNLDLNCRLTKRKKKREEQRTCGYQSPVAIGLQRATDGRKRSIADYSGPYLCHRCRWKIFQLLCLPCEHMVCFGCVELTWPWCPVCFVFIEDQVNIRFAT